MQGTGWLRLPNQKHPAYSLQLKTAGDILPGIQLVQLLAKQRLEKSVNPVFIQNPILSLLVLLPSEPKRYILILRQGYSLGSKFQALSKNSFKFFHSATCNSVKNEHLLFGQSELF